MSKSIYEEAIYNTQILLALVDVKQLNANKKFNMLTQIEQTLKQAQKQEKLLKLYQRLCENFSDIGLSEIILIKNKIKELENDK